MQVYKAINAVQAALAKEGIGKDRKNQAQGYNFRGIDDVYNALAPLLSQHGLCILPRVLSRECIERTSAKGGALFYVTVEMEFDFVSAADGSRHAVKTFGEAMDSGDKATNKAMSAAYKYASFQAFCIPTEGDNDADAQTHAVEVRAPMSEFILTDFLTRIAEAGSLADLQKAYNVGFRAAEAAKDIAAKKALLDAASLRRTDLVRAEEDIST